MPEEQQQLNEEQLANLEQRKRDYAQTFSSESGKRVLADLNNICFMNRTTYSNQDGKTLLNEGMRFVAVHINNIINMDIGTLKKLTRKGV